MSDAHTPSLADRSHGAKKSLEELLSRAESTESEEDFFPPEAIADILARFLLWTGNLGALHDPKKTISLDYRLADAPEIRHQIHQQLDDFQEAIDALASITSGEMPNRVVSDDVEDALDTDELTLDESRNGPSAGVSSSASGSSFDEVHILLEIMSQCIRALFRIAMLVRKAGRRDRFQHALQHSDPFEATYDIDYVKSRHSKLNTTDTEWLAKRLGEAIAKRRQFIAYCSDHKSRLGADYEVMDGTTEKQSSRATTILPERFIASRVSDVTVDDEDDNISLMTASTTFDGEIGLRLPRLNDLSPDGLPFECPICFTFQSFQREKSWKAHAFKDLKAYMCTFQNIDCEAELFTDRATWFEHELQHHRSRYFCSLCQEEWFNSKSGLMAHIKSHGSFGDNQLSKLAEMGRNVPARFEARDCPFCDEWAKVLQSREDRAENSSIRVSATRFKRHVATHQEQLALFAVPLSHDETGATSSADERDGSADGGLSDILSEEEDDGEVGIHNEGVLAEEIQEPLPTDGQDEEEAKREFEAELKAAEERGRREAEVRVPAEREARLKFEAEEKTKKEEEERARAEAVARIRFEEALKEEAEANAAALQKAQEEADRLMRAEIEAKAAAAAAAAAAEARDEDEKPAQHDLRVAENMWRCHGCFRENVLAFCPSCFNCAHIRCGYCEVYINPV